MEPINLLRACLQKIIDNIDAGNSNIEEEECESIIESINRLSNTETKYSKYQAYHYLHISRATFDNWVRSGRIPKGRKQQGFTEKFWYKRDLDKIKYE